MLVAIIILLGGLLFVAAYASFNIRSGVYVRAFCRKNTVSKRIALTFDDGPHPVYTPQVLDLLKQYNAKATFFVIGKNIENNEQVMKRIYENGHQIGNHSYTHRNTFPLLNPRKMADDLLQCEQAIEQSTGYKTEWFRPPFGVTNPFVAKALKTMNYRVAGWSIRSLDTIFDKDKAVKRVVRRLKPGAIILLHDRLPDISYILEKILQQASDAGYDFTTIADLQEKE